MRISQNSHYFLNYVQEDVPIGFQGDGSIFIRDGYGTPKLTMTLNLNEIYIPRLSLGFIEEVFK